MRKTVEVNGFLLTLEQDKNRPGSPDTWDTVQEMHALGEVHKHDAHNRRARATASTHEAPVPAEDRLAEAIARAMGIYQIPGAVEQAMQANQRQLALADYLDDRRLEALTGATALPRHHHASRGFALHVHDPLTQVARGSLQRSGNATCRCGRAAPYEWRGSRFCEQHAPWKR